MDKLPVMLKNGLKDRVEIDKEISEMLKSVDVGVGQKEGL